MSRSTTGVRQSLRTITVLAPVGDGAVPDVEGRLAELENGPSPFAASERTHFARLLVLPGPTQRQPRATGMRLGPRLLDLVTHLGRAQRPDSLSRPYLVFSAAYDDPVEDADPADHRRYVDHLRDRLGGTADDIWGWCAGYPGIGDPEAFRTFFAERTVPAGYVFTPAHEATVSRVTEALRLRGRVIAAAVATQDSSDADVRKRFDTVFASDAPALPDPAVTSPGTAGDLSEAMEWNGWATRDAEAYPALKRAARHPGPPDLADVQGLTVGYPTHDAAAFVFLRVVDPDRARAWLATVPVTSALAARATLATARSGAVGSGDGEEAARVARHVAVSHAGLTALGVPDDVRAGFDRSFRAGMARREHALAPDSGTGTWQDAFHPENGGLHVLVHFSARDDATLDEALHDLRTGLADAGLRETACERGRRIPGPEATGPGDPPDATNPSDSADPANPADAADAADALGAGRRGGGRRRFMEHFGFADGISQPVIAGLGGSREPTLPTGELLLGYEDVDGDTSGATAPSDLALNGSYLVFRKLEQDVPAFRALTGGDDALAAKLVGRHRDGTPLTPRVDGELQFQAEDAEGLHCPVGAHVRRVNPRDSRPLLDPGDDGGKNPVEPRLVRRHRMVRRGIPYGEPLPRSGPEAERGLLFVALVGDIGRQFEFVQAQWMNDGNAFRLGSDPDVFSGVAGPGRKVTIQGCPPQFVELPRPVVTCRGGEYFLLPGRQALRHLARASS